MKNKSKGSGGWAWDKVRLVIVGAAEGNHAIRMESWLYHVWKPVKLHYQDWILLYVKLKEKVIKLKEK